MKYNKMFLFKKNKERLCCNYSALLVHVNKYNKTIFNRETRRLFYCRYCGKLTIRVARFKSADAPPRRLRERWSPQTTKCYKRLVPGSVRGHTGDTEPPDRHLDTPRASLHLRFTKSSPSVLRCSPVHCSQTLPVQRLRAGLTSNEPLETLPEPRLLRMLSAERMSSAVTNAAFRYSR